MVIERITAFDPDITVNETSKLAVDGDYTAVDEPGGPIFAYLVYD